jgi:FKBP-type peptidyl-prolyl cis-trans isomerase 2
MTKVENLKKITLSFQAGTSPEKMDLTPKYTEFQFIFGLAPEGMTPLEYELVEKVEGDDFLLHLKKKDLNRFFAHNNPPIWNLFAGLNEIYMKVKVLEISDADNRKIVKAMADMTAHGGGGCDCGCGCG